MPDKKEVTIHPSQDKSLLGHEIFNSVVAPVDFCTVAQAAAIRERSQKPASVLESIASGELVSQLYTQKEAQEILNALASRGNPERR